MQDNSKFDLSGYVYVYTIDGRTEPISPVDQIPAEPDLSSVAGLVELSLAEPNIFVTNRPYLPPGR